jgi:hypothetical protein
MIAIPPERTELWNNSTTESHFARTEKRMHSKSNVSPSINKQQNTIEFNIHNQTAEQVSQVGVSAHGRR